jgi:hypothetical protein
VKNQIATPLIQFSIFPVQRFKFVIRIIIVVEVDFAVYFYRTHKIQC